MAPIHEWFDKLQDGAIKSVEIMNGSMSVGLNMKPFPELGSQQLYDLAMIDHLTATAPRKFQTGSRRATTTLSLRSSR